MSLAELLDCCRHIHFASENLGFVLAFLLFFGSSVMGTERWELKPNATLPRRRRRHVPECFARGVCSGGQSFGRYHAVVAAFDAWMILVAGDQQETVIIAVGKQPIADNLSAIIEERRRCQVQARTRRNQGIQVDNRT